ncbi:MAG TPA: hypothetical protein VK427_20610, partial [Kofleriaceae bacterium]|nr:hypothetical protein [Kofleriaceae bacterium]
MRNIADLLLRTWVIVVVTVVICGRLFASAANAIALAEAADEAPPRTPAPHARVAPAPPHEVDAAKITR